MKHYRYRREHDGFSAKAHAGLRPRRRSSERATHSVASSTLNKYKVLSRKSTGATIPRSSNPFRRRPMPWQRSATGFDSGDTGSIRGRLNDGTDNPGRTRTQPVARATTCATMHLLEILSSVEPQRSSSAPDRSLESAVRLPGFLSRLEPFDQPRRRKKLRRKCLIFAWPLKRSSSPWSCSGACFAVFNSRKERQSGSIQC